MVCSALFLQDALHIVYCANTMHSSRYLWPPPPFLVNTVNRYFYIRGNEVCHILLKTISSNYPSYKQSDIHGLALGHEEIELCSTANS